MVLKTTINLVIAQPSNLRWAVTDGAVREIPLALAQAAFAVVALPKPMGLYSAGVKGESLTVTNGISFAPLIHGDLNLVGGIFTFRGFRFLINLSLVPLPDNLTLPGKGMPEWERGNLMHRPARHRWVLGRAQQLSHVIDYGWERLASLTTLGSGDLTPSRPRD